LYAVVKNLSAAESFNEVSLASTSILYASELLTIYGQTGIGL